MKMVKKCVNRSAIALGVASAFSILAPQVNAISFEWGDVTGTFDSTWSFGASMRTAARDWDNQIGKVNQPGFDWSGYSAFTDTRYTTADIWAQEGSYSSNNDLSNILYSQGDTTSERAKGLHELSLKYQHYGLFARGMYFYDLKLNDGSYGFNDPLTGQKFDPCANSDASRAQCKDIRLLDAFVYANYDLNDGANPLSIRIGNQAISWGESTLIAHGLSEINAVDLNVLYAPGAELKEAFIPQGMIWASLGINDSLNIEAFYQYQWQEMWIPTPGSIFATNDFVGFGGYQQNAQLGFNANPDINLSFLLQEYQAFADQIKNGTYSAGELTAMGVNYPSPALAYPTKVALIQDPQSPKTSGQYGVKLGYYAPDLGETEFGFYFMNYHSRRPLLSGTASNFTESAIASDIAALNTATDINRELLLGLDTFAKVQTVYPEDIQLYGVSFNTLVGDTSVAGEVSYRHNEPLQIHNVELLFAGMPQQLANAGKFPAFDGLSQVDGVESGADIQGYKLFDTTQAQMTFTHLFGPTAGVDNLVMLAEVGGVWVHSMPALNELRLNGPGTARSGGNPDKEDIIALLHQSVETNPFPTPFSWGYRLVAKADINNVLAGINVSPRMIFAHDVEGLTPDPMFLFVERRKSLALGMNFDYQNRWGADVSYNTFFDGKGTANAMIDRDYVSFNIKYSI